MNDIPTGEREQAMADARALVDAYPPASTETSTFLGEQFDRGLAWVHFPPGRGGRDLPQGVQGEIDAVVQGAGGPDVFALNPMGYGMAAPTLVAHGSAALQDRLLRPLFTCEELWAQLFSEPGAGSDLAGLATRAERDGSVWRVTGQKVWTSAAHRARWALLLARTDPAVPKHRGLTFFVIDMQQAGVEVRPLRQMTGDTEFNEVYLDGAVVDDDWRLGDVGEGWRVAITTLMNERNSIGGGAATRGAGSIADAVRLWQEHPNLRSPSREEELLDLAIRAEAHRLTSRRHAAEQGDAPVGARATIAKLTGAELNQDVYEFCMRVLGIKATVYSYATAARVSEGASDARDDGHSLQYWFLRSRANTIEGGTSEVLRNVIGERLLGLPGDLRADKHLPWRDVPRS